MANISTLNRIKEISAAIDGKLGQVGRCRHYSFILKKNRIVSVGFNRYNKTHPILKKFNYPKYSGIHSEISAILKNGLTDCAGMTMVNTRINNGRFDNAAPCKYCAGMIEEMNFKDIIFTNKNGDWK